nr:MAG TPA: hypothetical protein [Caudoviricetes sp.]
MVDYLYLCFKFCFNFEAFVVAPLELHNKGITFLVIYQTGKVIFLV